jgi:hypothetical protein
MTEQQMEELQVERSLIESRMEAWAREVGVRVWHVGSGEQLLWMPNNIANAIMIRKEEHRWTEFLALVASWDKKWESARVRFGMSANGQYSDYVAEFSQPEAIEAVTEVIEKVKSDRARQAFLAEEPVVEAAAANVGSL